MIAERADTTCSTLLHFRGGLTVVEDGSDVVLATEARGTRLADPTPGLRAALALLAGDGASSDALTEAVLYEDGPLGGARLAYLLRRWGERGLLRSTLTAGGQPLLDAEPMVGGWQPPTKLEATTARYQLSRFASCRRRADHLVLESPLSTVRVTLLGPLAGLLVAALAEPQTAVSLADLAGRTGQGCDEPTAAAVLATLSAAGFVGEVDADGRLPEDREPTLAQWEPHDLAFHARSRRGRHDGETGATFSFASTIPPLPAVKPTMPGPRVPLAVPDLAALRATDPSLTAVLEDRRSVRRYAEQPITLGQLSELLYRAARVRSVGQPPQTDSTHYQISDRPYPSGGAIYDLEVYAAINRCDGLDPGLYHYDPTRHDLARLVDYDERVRRLLQDAEAAAALACPPQVLLILASRFQRASWKYSGSAYALTLKNTGVLIQSLYLVATAMGLAPCALGNGDSETFAQAAGLDPLAESSVAELLIGSLP